MNLAKSAERRKEGKRKAGISPGRDGTSAFALQVYGVTGKAQRHRGTKGEAPKGAEKGKEEG